MAGMRILNATEPTAFDTPPLFNHRERQQFFTSPKSLLEMSNHSRHPVNQACFVTSCGYFRATRRFFSPC